MAWIESHQTLSRHQKLLRAARMLRVDRHKLIGHLHELWWWGLDNVPANGDLAGLSDREIAVAAQWPGDAAAARRFVKTLTDVGFIDRDRSSRYLHDWWDYAGKLAARRAKDAERQAARRNAGQPPKHDSEGPDGTSIGPSSGPSDGQPPDIPRSSRATVQYSTGEPSPSGSGSPPGAREAAPELTDSVLRYHALTGSIPRGNALQWINRLDEEHGSAKVSAALDAEWQAGPDVRSLLGRVETRLGAGPARPEPVRSGWKTRTDYDALGRLHAVGERP